MLEDDFNVAMYDIVRIVHESVSSSYQTSLQIDWIPAMLQEHVVIASSSPSESKDEDDEYFNQEPLEDNREFMILIWEGIKKIYKLVKGK